MTRVKLVEANPGPSQQLSNRCSANSPLVSQSVHLSVLSLTTETQTAGGPRRADFNAITAIARKCTSAGLWPGK